MNPEHFGFMDPDMRDIWEKIDPNTLKGYQLHGGTALALYLNHRKSTDFDFFRADGGPVERRLIEQWAWLRHARFRGSSGMVDAVVDGPRRAVAFNFVGIDDFNGIAPRHPPNIAANGVRVGHPVDVLTGKLAAMSNRRMTRDYWDVACAFRHIPEALGEAAELYISDYMTVENTVAELAKTVMAFPLEAEQELPEPLIAELSGFASSLGRHIEPTQDTS